jgi:acyl carrier protein
MVHDRVRAIVGEHGRLSVAVEQLPDDASLYQAGLTSHASVNLMLAIEESFGIEFPERMLRRRTFESIAAIAGAVRELAPPGAGA